MPTRAPRISVALPVYNGADYVGEALDNILSQDFEDFELVISENSSTDDTPGILAEYARRDSRVRV
ncbi:MAG: glycosyltransferase, partial [Gemmatimonadota bacterium]|nr:glycosyltransferase [Gemmatimonadota bacterium]